MTTIRAEVRRRLLTTGIGILAAIGVLTVSTPAHAITFTFDCQILHPPGSTCGGAGAFGTLDIVPSMNDPFRVDLMYNLTPGFGQTLERILLNYDGPAGTQLRMLSTSAPMGATAPLIGVATDPCNNCQTLGEFGFDVRLSPTAPASLMGSFSLALFNGQNQVGITPDDFDLTTQSTPQSSGTPPLFAAYRTNVLGGGVGEFWSGAPGGTPPVIPEPASLLLLGTGLLGLAGVAARRRAAAKKKMSETTTAL